MEKRTELKVRIFRIEMMCDKCNEGQMKPTGMVYETYPPQYPHKCDKCGYENTFDEVYPRIDQKYSELVSE